MLNSADLSYALMLCREGLRSTLVYLGGFSRVGRVNLGLKSGSLIQK